MTDAKKLAKAMADNERAGKSNRKMLDFVVRTKRVPSGVTIDFDEDGRYVVTFRTDVGFV